MAVSRIERVFPQVLIANSQTKHSSSREPDPRSALTRIYRLQLDKISISAALAALSANPDVAFVEPDYIARPALVPDDELLHSQWGLAAIQAGTAWDVVTGTATTVIAIVDSGIDMDHIEFAERLWVNPGEIPDNGLDDDGNGFVDDVHGWDFVYGTNNPIDENGHGTEVSGVAAATANNGVGIAGMCWGCRIMTVKVMQPSGIANYSDVAAGIVYAADKGAQVINLSLGGYSDSAILRAAVEAASKKAVIIGGAGNDGVSTPFYPAAYPSVLAVAGTTASNTKSDFSNYGSWVDVAAPGDDVLTTFAGGDWGGTSGTSLSASFVSGLAGLLHGLHPEWSPQLIHSHIVKTADNLTPSDPAFGSQMGAGLINTAAAMEAPQPALEVDGYALNGAANGLPTPGSSGNSLALNLVNSWYDAEQVHGTLSTENPNVTIADSQVAFGDIANGESATASAFTFDLSAGVGYSQELSFSLHLTANEGAYSVTLPFTLTTCSPQEHVSDYIQDDTTWVAEKIYVLDGDVTVNAGVTLTIKPGTTVLFNGNYSLFVNGTLIADGIPDLPVNGTPIPDPPPDQMIVFASNTAGRWNQIHFNDGSPDAQANGDGNYLSGSILRHVSLESSTGGISCSSATPYLAHIQSASSGINCLPGATPLWLLDNTLSGGIYVTLGTAYVQRNTLSGQGLHATGMAVVLTNTVTGASLSIGNGTLSGNTVDGGSLGMGSYSTAEGNTIVGGGISAGNLVTVSANSITGGGISVGSSSKVISNTVRNAPFSAITTGNDVVARGNRLIGNGQGMVATTGEIINNLIANNIGIGLQAGMATITNNSFSGNQGNALVVQGANPIKIQRNNFEGNLGPYDLYVDLPWSQYMYVVATSNWWGTTDTQTIAERIYDFNDDSSRAKVTYINWLSSPAQDAPAYVRGLDISPDNVLGIQFGTFAVRFSRPMDSLFNPSLTFCTARRGSWDQYTANNSDLPEDTVTAIRMDLYGNPWFGTLSSGVAHMVDSTWTRYTAADSGLPGDTVNAIAVDADASVWFGTTQGAAKLSGSNWSVYTATHSALPDDNVLSLAVDFDRAKWFGTAQGLAWFDGATWVTYTVSNSGLPSNWVGAIAQDIDRSMWFGTDSGVAHYDGLAWTTYNAANSSLPGGQIQALAIDADGTKWFGTDLGLTRFDGATWTAYTDTLYLPGVDVRAIAVDPNDVKWIATTAGLASYDGEKWETFPTASSDIPGDEILSLAASDRGSKWLGFNAAGVGVLYDSPDYAIADNANWADAQQYQASFGFSALVPKGVYSITIGSALGLDRILSAPSHAYTFTVDYASFVADDTPPPSPSVIAGSDGTLNAISLNLSASDEDSAITAYRYAIGTTPGGQEVINWTETAGTSLEHSGINSLQSTSFIRDGLTLLPGQICYVAAQARNAGGLWSPVGISNAVIAGTETQEHVYLPLVVRSP